MNIKILFWTLLLLALTSCNKEDDSSNADLCDGVVCLNGGGCLDGTCLCSDGYSGVNCETFDPCFNTTCLNDGTCENGNCLCADGFAGADCSQMVAPISISITKVVLKAYPPFNIDGGRWDVDGSTADAFPILIQDATSTFYIFQDEFIQDADPTSTYEFIPSDPIVFTEINEILIILIQDIDGSDSENMSYEEFNLFTNLGEYPEIRTLGANAISPGFLYDIYLTYQF